MNEWMTDRRPTEEGGYLVTMEIAQDDGSINRWTDIRFFEEAQVSPTGWEMAGEDYRKPHWTQQTWSWPDERVVAWRPMPEPYDDSH